MRKRLFSLWGTVVIIGVLSFAWAGYLAFSYDSRITLQKLQGKNPDQVLAILGAPRFPDPRTHGWSEVVDGPLSFYYSGPFDQEYAVIFENNQVVKVIVTRK